MLKLVWLEPGMGSDVRVEGNGIWPGWIQYGALWQSQARSMSHRFLEPHYSALRGVPEEDVARAISRLYGLPERAPSRVQWLGDACTPYCNQATDVKPYMYKVQSGDGMWSICKKFKQNCDPHENCNGWGLLAAANPQWPAVTLNGVCVLQINPGDGLKIPASWPDPNDWNNIVCSNGKPYDPAIGCASTPITIPTCQSDADCGPGQVCVGNKCVTLCANKNQRIEPATGSCVQCSNGQQRDAKDPTKCVAIPVATAGMSGAGLFLLASGALVAIYMAVTQGGKGLAYR